MSKQLQGEIKVWIISANEHYIFYDEALGVIKNWLDMKQGMLSI